MEKILDRYLPLVLIVFLLIPLLDLLNPGLPVTHDGQDHIARIASFYKNLTEGNLVPRWAENLNWGFGHPILMFLYPFPSYASSFFHFLGFSFVDSFKIFMGLSYVLSGIFMYLWSKEHLGKASGFIAAIAYTFAPYRFVDLYVRGAIGEHSAFLFPPLIFYFLLRLSKKYSPISLLGLSVSLAFLILSHNAISLMFVPLFFAYGIYLYFQTTNRKSFLISSSSGALFGFLLSAFFWFPALYEGKYTLRYIVTAGEYAKRFVEPLSLIYSPWSYGGSGSFSVQIGLFHLFGTLVSIYIFYKLFKAKDKKSLLYLIFLVFTFVYAFLMLRHSDFIWSKIPILQNFQFPWRFLSPIVFTTSFLLASSFSYFFKKNITVWVFAFSLLMLIISLPYQKARDYVQRQESFYTGIYEGTTDTGESSPIWSVRFMEERPRAHIEVIEGSAEIEEVRRNSEVRIYRVESQNGARLKENTLYFPGWKVFVDGEETNIEFQDQKHRGLITFEVPKGEHEIVVSFTDTKVRKYSDMLSLVSIPLFLVFTIAIKRWRLYL